MHPGAALGRLGPLRWVLLLLLLLLLLLVWLRRGVPLPPLLVLLIYCYSNCCFSSSLRWLCIISPLRLFLAIDSGRLGVELVRAASGKRLLQQSAARPLEHLPSSCPGAVCCGCCSGLWLLVVIGLLLLLLLLLLLPLLLRTARLWL